MDLLPRHQPFVLYRALGAVPPFLEPWPGLPAANRPNVPLRQPDGFEHGLAPRHGGFDGAHAREEQLSAAYIYILLRLPWLAPDITTAIINGRKPPQLTAQTLMRLTPRLPANWAEQRKLLGFR